MKNKIVYTIIMGAIIATCLMLPSVAAWLFAVVLAITIIGKWLE